MLDRWLASLSKTTLAVGSIIGGILLIILFKPLHTVCDSQKEIFKDSVKSIFFIEVRKKEVTKKNKFTRRLDACRFDGRPGSCFELFESLRFLNKQLLAVSSQCIPEMTKLPEIKDAIWKGMGLMVRLAWGETAPKTFMERAGWLSDADISLFCHLKRQSIKSFGQAAWEKFREKQFEILPGAKELSRNEAWSRMIFSFKCNNYL